MKVINLEAQKGQGVLMISDVRIAYPSLFTPTSFDENADKYYEVTLIIDDEAKKELKKIIENRVRDTLNIPVTRMPLENRGLKPDVKKNGEENHLIDGNYLILKAKSKMRPIVIDQQRRPIIQADGVIFGGCWINAILKIDAFKSKYGNFVSCQLSAVQLVRQDEPIGSSSVVIDIESDFDVIEGVGNTVVSQSSQPQQEEDDW